MEEREAILRRWFSMWLEGKDQGIADLFQEDALVYRMEHPGQGPPVGHGGLFSPGAGDHGDLAVSLPDGRRDRAGF